MKTRIFILGLGVTLILAACANNNEDMNPESGNQHPKSNSSENSESHMEEMEHSGSPEVPEGLKRAEDPTYPEGSKAMIETDHMPGMKGAEATIAGAFESTSYVVSYKPTNGGDPVENHKWVIHEELNQPDSPPLKPGTEVTLEASHMKGMKGAKATIDSANKTTVYMIDYKPTTGGEEVTNHKWVTEEELSPIE
ncbi:YdhK family protein [Bacillus sp. RAR_GA_16]|uniref:YdhK family protein n=1 Tax=Bacillus sp. RAR_GA_16 TaxID=2876774 RepID=UPI001CD03AF2|nr:YdhK family protein [Bacillus sp. RAR_GA_16]MCA0171905.1 YdhK family protein [Bacillus sp. RAR_GA_16]